MSISSVKTGAIGDSLLAGNAAFNPSSFESIATATGTGSSGTITFSSIPSTYTSLQIRMLGKTATVAAGADALDITFNGDTGSNYVYHNITGDGASATAGASSTSTTFIRIGAGAGRANETNICAVSIIDIHDYASTTRNKTMRRFGGFDKNASGGSIILNSGLWMSTSAITSIEIASTGGNFTTANVFSLYGIKGA
jgi:hypothetical protein